MSATSRGARRIDGRSVGPSIHSTVSLGGASRVCRSSSNEEASFIARSRRVETSTWSPGSTARTAASTRSTRLAAKVTRSAAAASRPFGNRRPTSSASVRFQSATIVSRGASVSGSSRIDPAARRTATTRLDATSRPAVAEMTSSS